MKRSEIIVGHTYSNGRKLTRTVTKIVPYTQIWGSEDDVVFFTDGKVKESYIYLSSFQNWAKEDVTQNDNQTQL